MLNEVLAHCPRINRSSLLIEERHDAMGKITRKVRTGISPKVVSSGVGEKRLGSDVREF
jgi:hypothetical protein